MEINKQLFEDVLSGKLKGIFVSRNGSKICSDMICRNTDNFYSSEHEKECYPYMHVKNHAKTYTISGRINELYSYHFDFVNFIPDTIEIDPEIYSYNENDIQFIEHFINGYHMKQNELMIEIPDGKEIDWDESKKQNKIVLKDKKLTYGEVCRKLFDNQDHYHITHDGSIEVAGFYRCACEPNASKDRHQLECILAKNKLANVAMFLNDGWKPSDGETIYVLNKDYVKNTINIDYWLYAKCNCSDGEVIFKSKELAKQAIEILGEETVKLALEPLGI